MKIKSLLLGSAAALVAVSGARAADAVVIPEPEAVEYVRVCDAAGTGYFYIPGTETCLKIGGYVRYQMDFNVQSDNNWLTGTTKADVTVSSWTDSEYGAVTTFIELVGIRAHNNHMYDYYGSEGAFKVDNAYLTIGGLKMGYFDNFADGTGLNGETDSNKLNTKWNRIQYTGTAGGVSFGVGVDLLDEDYFYSFYSGSNDAGLGVDAMIGFTAGAMSAKIVGFYDLDGAGSGQGGVIGMVSADVGPGTLQARAIWQSDGWSWYGTSGREYTLEASYAFQASDKLKLTPGVSFDHYYGGVDGWDVGLTADYQLTKTFAVKATVNYHDQDNWSEGYTNGFVRFQASF